MIAQCWLHIGIEHTGSTTIQTFLARNRDRLLSQGFLYPKAPGETNHLGLTAYCLNDLKIDDVRLICGINRPEAVPPYRKKLMAALTQEVAGSNASAIVLSNEHLSTRLRKPREFERLKNICREISSNTKVLVYIRNQVDLVASEYSTNVKAGGTRAFSFPPKDGNLLHLADYAKFLEPWCEMFGRENVIVRRFEAGDFPNGDLVADFAAQLGLDTGAFETVPRLNPSLPAASIAFLREFNKSVPRIVDGQINPLRRLLVNILQNYRAGERLLLPPEYATAIAERYRESNEKVSADFFGGRFSPLFSAASAVGAAGTSLNDTIDTADAIALAAHLWTEQQQKIRKMEERFKKRRARRKADA